MLFTTLSSLGLMASAALAAPTILSRRATGAQNVVYWGQNGGGTIENPDLSTYCTSDSGIDIIVLAFLYQYGNGNTVASGTIGQSCYIDAQGNSQECGALSTAINTCQSNGIKVMLSLGGASGAYSLSSPDEARKIGQYLWDAYGNGGKGSAKRPLGDSFVNGWDFDIESNSGNANYQYLISTLRGNFAKDPSNTYYITGAPQCPLPEPNMSEIISAAQFDYLWVQFYNNPGCSTNNADINFDDWVQNVATGPSKGAKIFIGVPAAPDGATGTSSGAQYYLDPSKLATLVTKHSTGSNAASFGGVMLWSAGFSDSNVIDGLTYAKHVKQILGGASPVPAPATSSSAAPAPAPTAAPTYSSSSAAAPRPSPTSSSAPAVPNKQQPTRNPLPATSTTTPAAAAPSPTETSTSAPPPPPTTDSSQQSGPCGTEGEWACVSGSHWQRCAGGTWSVLMALPAGIKCEGGVGATLDMSPA